MRGVITDRQGKILARTVKEKEGLRREYPLGEAAAQVIGYASNRFGSSGLEAAYAGELLGIKGWARFKNLAAQLAGRQPRGADLSLTLDADLQDLAYRLLAGRRGAIVALDPRTGAVLALASSPSFNPNNLAGEMARIAARPGGSPLLNRAIQGVYPPGSTLKPVTAAAALGANTAVAGGKFVCPGFLEVNGRRLHCPHPHGTVDFSQAMMYSCNVTFAKMALEVGGENFVRTAESFGFNQEIPLELPVLPGRLPPSSKLNANELAEIAIGQGEVTTTPLHMALIAAAIANDGLMMRPFIVESVKAFNGRVIWQVKPRVWRVTTGAEVAKIIRRAMEAVVARGTGQAAELPGVRVAGKTGSAQNPQGKAHAWFIGFAPVEAPRAAVAVIIENGGAGGEVAAPLAREVLAKAIGVVD